MGRQPSTSAAADGGQRGACLLLHCTCSPAELAQRPEHAWSLHSSVVWSMVLQTLMALRLPCARLQLWSRIALCFMLGFRPDLGLLDGSGSHSIPFSLSRASPARSARPERATNGACGVEWRLFFDQGLLGSTCIVSGRILACWLAVARMPFRVVDMARCVPSRHAKSSSKMVHVAWNGACSLIADCSAVHASFLAGFGRAGWLWLACYSAWSMWRAVSPHGTPRARHRRCMWRGMAPVL